MEDIELIRQREVDEGCDITPMTNWRWRKAGILPKPVVINGRNYFNKAEIEAVKRRFLEQSEAA